MISPSFILYSPSTFGNPFSTSFSTNDKNLNHKRSSTDNSKSTSFLLVRFFSFLLERLTITYRILSNRNHSEIWLLFTSFHIFIEFSLINQYFNYSFSIPVILLILLLFSCCRTFITTLRAAHHMLSFLPDDGQYCILGAYSSIHDLHRS